LNSRARVGHTQVAVSNYNRDWLDLVGDIPKHCGKRISGNNNETQKTALEETRASQKPAHKIKREEQSQSESIGKTRRSPLSKSGRQHERGEKAEEEKVEEESLTLNSKGACDS